MSFPMHFMAFPFNILVVPVDGGIFASGVEVCLLTSSPCADV
jgi:hypothetical protein